MKHLVLGKTKCGVPQRPILRPLLFSIHLCDFFYFLEDLDIASYADMPLKKTKSLLLIH